MPCDRGNYSIGEDLIVLQFGIGVISPGLSKKGIDSPSSKGEKFNTMGA
jgi:hypothetical protein